MSFEFRNRGDDVILDEASTVAYSENESIRDDVVALAVKNVGATNRPCRVFANDGSTQLVEVIRRPDKTFLIEQATTVTYP
jgi:hypothetical protein